MTKQLLIYEKVEPLNRVAHRDLSVRQTRDFSFARGTNSVPIVDIEFARVAGSMPIVFTRTKAGIVPCALLGTGQDDNAFVADDGSWTGRYVPAFFRRYPFVFAMAQGGGKLTLSIDTSYAGLNTDGEGERIFDATGAETGYTRNVLKFVEKYQQAFVRTQAFCARLDKAGLLEEARVDYTLPDGSKGGLTGFLRVSVTKLAALDDAEVVRMFRSGELALLQTHMISLQQAEVLVGMQRSGAHDDAETAEDATADEVAFLN